MPAAKFVAKGDWICRSRRARQIHLQEAKIVSDFYSIRAIFAFMGFVNGLAGREFSRPRFARCLSPAPDAIQTRMRQRFPAFAGNRNGAVRFAAMRERRRDWMAARLPRTSLCRSARQMRAKERATRRKRKIKGRGRKRSAATAFALSSRSLMPPASALVRLAWRSPQERPPETRCAWG